MGAALTYARRYALFTLVGIAGEDDIDAPDLNAPMTTSTSPAGNAMRQNNNQLNGGQRQSFQQKTEGAARDHAAKAVPRPFPPLLEDALRRALRDQLAAELSGIGSANAAAAWASGFSAQRALSVCGRQTYREGFSRRSSQTFDGIRRGGKIRVGARVNGKRQRGRSAQPRRLRKH